MKIKLEEQGSFENLNTILTIGQELAADKRNEEAEAARKDARDRDDLSRLFRGWGFSASKK